MTLIDIQDSKNVSLDKLNLKTDGKKDSKGVSFVELLKGASVNDKDVVKTDSLILALNSDKNAQSKDENKQKDTLLSLLTSLDNNQDIDIDKLIELEDSINLSVNTPNTNATTDLKQLISNAKKYLEDQILQSSEFKKSEIKDMPKTLKTLTTLAKKFDLNIEKIKYEKIKPKNLSLENSKLKDTIELKTPTSKRVITQNSNSSVNLVKTQNSNDMQQPITLEKLLKNSNSKSIDNSATTDIKLKDSSVALKDNKTDKDIKIDIDEKDKVKLKKVTDNKVELKESSLDSKSVNTKESNKDIGKTIEITKDVEVKQDSKSIKNIEVTKEVKTEQTQVKQIKKEQSLKNQKVESKSENSSNSKQNLGAIFESTKVVSNAQNSSNSFSQNSNSQKNSFESLLRGKNVEDESTKSSEFKIEDSIKTSDSNSISKVDNLDVKINEAKQMIKYLSSDVKDAIDNYKAPFSRVKVQLNPKNLGDIDVTIVERGKNLHINLTSNNSAINTLSMNINELKVQLNQNGINNATFNFNSSSQGGENSNGANQQQQQNAKKEYNYFEQDEQNEDIVNSLEIVVAHYA